MSSANTGWDVVPDGKKTSKGKNVEKGKFSANADLFMKLPDGEHKIRLIGRSPHTIYVAWIPNPYKKKDEKFAKGKEPKLKVIVPEAYIDRLKSVNIIPRENFAMMCFDRADTKNGITRIKIIEKGPVLFRAFKAWAKAHASDDGVLLSPGDPVKGPDWFIEATVPDNILETTYQITPIEAKPLTKVEVELCKRDPDADENKDKPLGEKGPIDLKKYYDAEKERGAKALEIFFKNNNTLEDTQSVDDFVGAKPAGISSLDDLPAADEDDASEESVSEQLKSIF